jgi:hypothetical protein
MPKTVFNIFLSSTFTDLERHRATVREIIRRLDQADVCMETFGAPPRHPLKRAARRFSSPMRSS